MSERNLIGALIGSRVAFDRVVDHLGEEDLTDQGRIILEHVTEYYNRDAGALVCDPQLLARDVARSLSNPKHKETFTNLIDSIVADGTSAANVVHDFIAVKREAVGHRLASMLAAGRDPNDVRPLISEYEEWCQAQDFGEEDDGIVCAPSAEDLVASTTGENLIEVWPPVLSQRLDGGCLPGHHIVVFARPEMGKTMFLVNASAGFLAAGRKVLYVGNEEPWRDTAKRVVSRLTGMTRHDIEQRPERATAAAMDAGYENFYIVELSPGTPREVERAVMEVQPEILIVDQIRNLNMGESNFVQKLEKAATSMRNLGKKHQLLVLSATQAGDSAEGKAILDMGDCDFSNTGIPAACDVMLGVGATPEDDRMGRRVLSLCKNKRSGVHDALPVNVDLQTSSIGG